MGELRKIGPKGTSMGISLPPGMMDEIGVGRGDRLSIKTDGNRIIMQPVTIRPVETDTETA